MNKTRAEKIKENPELSIIANELDKFSAIESVYNSKGGEILFKSLMSDVTSGIDTLIAKYSKLTHIEFISLSADIKTKLDLARILKKSVKNKKIATEDLETALLETE